MFAIKSILNKLQCPLCKGQIDGVYKSFTKVQKFWCANVKNHYEITFVEDLIKTELINLYNYQELLNYEIVRDCDNNNTVSFTIRMRQIDAEGRIIFSFEDKVFTTSIDIFDFKNFNKDKALNKIKTVMLFQ